jgi:hypothetical protein
MALLCVVVVACSLLAAIPAQGASTSGTRLALPNDMSIELLGKSVLYTFGYQHMIGNFVGLEAGLSAIGGGTTGDNATVVFVPVGAKFYMIPKDGSLYLTGGVVFVTASFDAGPFDDTGSDAYSYLGLGMEYRSPSGLLFRGTAYGLIEGDGFFIWPGLTVGYAF